MLFRTLFVFLLAVSPQVAFASVSLMTQLFTTHHTNELVLKVEAAMARAQAQHGMIPGWAAEEISLKADPKYAPANDIAAEYELVRHRMVALLNVWGRHLDGGAAEYVHFGATTVDIYDTVMVLQLREATAILLQQLLSLELVLLDMAAEHKATIMVGRTLGQHALPITFGKKVSTWLGENRRHIARLRQVDERLCSSAILKGAVGSYLGLGVDAISVEQAFAAELGQCKPYLADWHGTRDVFAEYAQLLGLFAKSWGRIGQELFLLQMTDIGETVESRPKTAVGSSTMPHKNNPSKSEALMQHGREIPRLAEVALDDVQNFFERDNTSRPNKVLANISMASARMLVTATHLLNGLIVNESRMRANLDLTRQLLMAQRLTFALAEKIGKTTANSAMHEIAKTAYEQNLDLGTAFRKSELSTRLSDAELEHLLDPETYVGLAVLQTEQVINQIKSLRKAEGKQ